MEYSEERIIMLQDSVDMVFGPCRIDHEERSTTQAERVVVHEDSVVSSAKVSLISIGVDEERTRVYPG